MPVLVTAAHRPLARRIAARLLEEGGEVRAFTDGDVASLRAGGAFVAAGAWDDEGLLEAALADVHTVVHVGGGIVADPDRIVHEAEVVAAAAARAGIRRLVALSAPGASSGAPDPFRRAKAAAEAAVQAVRCPTIVVRVSLVDTPAIRDALATAGLSPPRRAVRIAPVRPDDLVELVVGFDRARSRAVDGHLVVAADGPVRMTVEEYLRRVGVEQPGRQSLVGRRLPSTSRTERLAAALDGPWINDDPRVADGWRFAGRAPTAPGPAG